MTTPVAGITHHVTLRNGTTVKGLRIEPGSYRRERADDFAPRIATGNDPTTREGLWDSWAQSGLTEGIDQQLFTSRNKFYRSDGNIFSTRDRAVALDAQWSSSDAAKVATAPQAIDFLTDLVLVGVGTKVRRYSVSVPGWTDSTTTFAGNVIWLHKHGVYAYAAITGSTEFYRSADGDTWTQVTTTPASQPATCMETYEVSGGTVNLVIATANTIKLSADDGVVFGSAINIGDASANITNLKTAFSVLFIGKEDGLYYYDGTNVKTLYQNRNLKYVGNMLVMVEHQGFLYINFQSKISKISITDGNISNFVDVTPTMVGDDDKELYGHGLPIWGWSGVNSLFVAFDDGEGVYPEVLEYTGLGWHQAYRGTSGDTMRGGGYSRLGARTFINDGATRARRHVSLSNFPFPDYPSSAQFETSDFDGGRPFDLKAFRDLSLEARNLSVADGRQITIEYSTDKGVTYTTIGTISTDGKTEIVMDVDPGTVDAQHIRLRFTLTRGSTTTETPVLLSWAVSFLLRPNPLYAHSFNALLGPNQSLLDNSQETETVADMLQVMDAFEQSSSPLRFVDFVGRNYLVYITKTATVRSEEETVLRDTRTVQVVMIDATSGLWPQFQNRIEFTATLTVELITYVAAVWDTAVWGSFQWE